MTTKTAIFLDFDGVICDSINECLVSSWIAYYEYYKNRYQKKDTPNFVPIELRKWFLEYRPYITRGEDYVLIQKLIEEGTICNSNMQFESERNKTGRETMSLFHKLFYDARDYLIGEDFNYWLNLNRLFSFIRKPLATYSNNRNLHILSTKKEKYILAILEYNGIDMNPSQIHYSGSNNKLSIVSDLINILRYEKAILIDDQIDNLRNNSDSRIKPVLALWGFIDKSWLKEYPKIARIDRNEISELMKKLLDCT